MLIAIKHINSTTDEEDMESYKQKPWNVNLRAIAQTPSGVDGPGNPYSVSPPKDLLVINVQKLGMTHLGFQTTQ